MPDVHTQPQPRRPASRLERIPLGLRVPLYCVAFLATVIGLLPWAAVQLDRVVSGWRFELGYGRWTGATLFAAALLCYLYATYVLTRRGRGAYVEFDPPREFVSEGPFRWCRNPIAACVVLMLWGEALALSSIGVLLLALVAIPLAHAQVIFLEEPLLRARFGAAYEAYLERVPRWLPRRPA